HQAWRLALEGGAGAPLIAEAMIPSALDSSLAPAGATTVTLLLHPVANIAAGDADALPAIEEAAAATLARLLPGSSEMIVAIDLETPVPAALPIALAVMRQRAFADAVSIDGYFFCGPEARLGARESLSAGRRAAERALSYARDRR
ncbi:MAG: hypothetical protein ACKVS5_00255, partial [Parvularculaceae bacterium]